MSDEYLDLPVPGPDEPATFDNILQLISAFSLQSPWMGVREAGRISDKRFYALRINRSGHGQVREYAG